MSAAVLREAAALMRTRAEATAHDSGILERWESDVRDDGRAWISSVNDGHMISAHGLPNTAGHIASWHPVVALAVARLLETEATLIDNDLEPEPSSDALAVARAYLGST